VIAQVLGTLPLWGTRHARRIDDPAALRTWLPSRRAAPYLRSGRSRARRQMGRVESGCRAPFVIYCASVSPSVRRVSSNVRLVLASVSRNVRRKLAFIARRAVHHCAPLHLIQPSQQLQQPVTGGYADEAPSMAISAPVM
jgi:hypothetical protein